MIALLGLLLVACSGERATVEQTQPANTAADGPVAVAFDAYQQRSSMTRSGMPGVLDIDGLKKLKAEGGGFGVFGYYTDLKKYDQTYVPNFMYNQGVFWNATTNYWEYSPLTYWPNEYGFDASSDDEDHLSFFAYAPYVQHTSAAAGSVADATYGIIGFSRNNATGDPMVRYIASFDPAKSVDLCWGVVPSDKTSWARIQNGSTQTLKEGLPWLDVYRPLETASQQAASSSSRVKFKFNHALAQLNVQIDTDIDVTTHQDGTDPDLLDAQTKVYVRSISFTGIALQGALNLNNTTANQALWLDWCGCTDLAYGQKVTIHDGRRDSREGAAGAEAPNETPQGLNPAIIQNSVATNGVTPTYQNLFKPTSANPADQLEDAVCVIPTGEAMTITIVYDIETTNPKLGGFISDGTTHGVSIENKVTKTVTFGGVYGKGLESNKRYTLKLHLGMNSVKFDADVSEWADNTVDGDAWLPSNERPIVLSQTVMYLGAPQTLTATLAPDYLGQTITWSNEDDAIATFGGTPSPASRRAKEYITGSSVTMTPVAVSATPTKVVAELPTGDKAECLVYVVPVVIKYGTVPPNKALTANLVAGGNLTLTAETVPATDVSGVTWTVSSSGVVSLSTTTGTTCTVHADAGGIVTVTATNPNDGSDIATCEITVTELTLNKSTLLMAAGGATETLTITNLPTGETVTWSSSNTGVATVDPSTGVVTPVSAGTATITGTTSSGGTATCTVTVNDFALSASNTTIGVNGSTTSSAITLTGNTSGETVTWTVTPAGAGAPTIASGTATGCTLNAGTAAGTYTITATGSSTGETATCTVTVTSVTLNKTSASIKWSRSETLTATTAPNTETITWTSSNPTDFPVNSSTGEVTVNAYTGSATITATASPSGAKATCTVTAAPLMLSDVNSNDDIGKVIGENGQIFKNVSDATSESHTAQAMIAYVGSYSTTQSSCTNGLAIALEDAGADVWANNATVLSNWMTTNSISVSGYSDWRIPTTDDWQYILSCGQSFTLIPLSTMDASTATFGLTPLSVATPLATKMATAGGTDFSTANYSGYQTSSECGLASPPAATADVGNLGWVYYFSGNHFADIQKNVAGSERNIRACLAF